MSLTLNIVDERFAHVVNNTDTSTPEGQSLRAWRLAYLGPGNPSNHADEGYIKPQDLPERPTYNSLEELVTKRAEKDQEGPVSNGVPLAASGLTANDYINQWFSRSAWVNGLLDPRRDICAQCGYPEMNAFISPLVYRELYDRDSLAARVVQVLPKECWQQNPSVYEDEDSENETEFELAWKEVHQTLRSATKIGGSWYQDEEGSPIWEYLLRADILSGIGHYGVLLLGIDDGRPLDQPLEEFDGLDSVNPGTDGLYGPQPMRGDAVGYDAYTTKQLYEQGVPSYATPVPYNVKDTGRLEDGTEESVSKRAKGAKRKLLFMKVFDESLAQITRYERDPHNARFGLPQMYLLTFNDPRNDSYGGAGLPVASAHCHWSRLIHIADNLGSNDVLGYPRMKQVFNRLWDAFKTYGAAGEGFWQMCFSLLSLETNPALGADFPVDTRKIQTQLSNLKNKLQRHIVTAGMTVKSLPPNVIDPTPFVNVFIEAVCIFLGCPVRVFKGSERGELASSQDDASWNDRLRHRQNFYVTPKIIVPLVDRLIAVKVLPEPEGYSVVWPDLDAMTDDQKAGVAQKYMAAFQAYIASGAENILTPIDFLVEFCKLPYHVAQEIVNNAKKAQDAEEQQTIDTPEDIEAQQRAMQGPKYDGEGEGEPAGNFFIDNMNTVHDKLGRFAEHAGDLVIPASLSHLEHGQAIADHAGLHAKTLGLNPLQKLKIAAQNPQGAKNGRIEIPFEIVNKKNKEGKYELHQSKMEIFGQMFPGARLEVRYKQAHQLGLKDKPAKKEAAAPVRPASKKPGSESGSFSGKTPVGVRRLGGGVNGSYHVHFADGSSGVFKPKNEESADMRRNVPEKTSYRREAAASDVAKAVGMHDLVPHTEVVKLTVEQPGVHGKKFKNEEGSVQAFVQQAKIGGDLPQARRFDGDKDLARAAAFDVLINNTDRHSGNWMIGAPKDRLVLIDHGLAFPTDNKGMRSWLMNQAAARNLKIPKEVLDWNPEAVRAAMEKNGLEPKAVDHALGRLAELQKRASADRGFNGIKKLYGALGH